MCKNKMQLGEVRCGKVRLGVEHIKKGVLRTMVEGRGGKYRCGMVRQVRSCEVKLGYGVRGKRTKEHVGLGNMRVQKGGNIVITA